MFGCNAGAELDCLDYGYPLEAASVDSGSGSNGTDCSAKRWHYRNGAGRWHDIAHPSSCAPHFCVQRGGTNHSGGIGASGIGSRVVEKMEDSVLEQYANAAEIQASIAYYHVPGFATPALVSEEAALQAAGLNDGVQALSENSNQDGYVKVIVTSAKVLSINYVVTGTFEWLTEPVFGGLDALNVASGNCTFNTNSASGYVSYNKKTYSGNTLTSDKEIVNQQTVKLRYDDNGNVLGIGFQFNMYTDRYSSTTSKLVDDYSDWYGAISATGTIIDSSLTSFYNSASYNHQYVTVSTDPTFRVKVRTEAPHASAYVDVAIKFASAYRTVWAAVAQLT